MISWQAGRLGAARRRQGQLAIAPGPLAIARGPHTVAWAARRRLSRSRSYGHLPSPGRSPSHEPLRRRLAARLTWAARRRWAALPSPEPLASPAPRSTACTPVARLFVTLQRPYRLPGPLAGELLDGEGTPPSRIGETQGAPFAIEPRMDTRLSSICASCQQSQLSRFPLPRR